jgi:hypothetical protein
MRYKIEIRCIYWLYTSLKDDLVGVISMFVLVKVEGASSVHTVSSRSCQNSIISIWISGKSIRDRNCSPLAHVLFMVLCLFVYRGLCLVSSVSNVASFSGFSFLIALLVLSNIYIHCSVLMYKMKYYFMYLLSGSSPWLDFWLTYPC